MFDTIQIIDHFYLHMILDLTKKYFLHIIEKFKPCVGM